MNAVPLVEYLAPKHAEHPSPELHKLGVVVCVCNASTRYMDAENQELWVIFTYGVGLRLV